MKESVLDVLIYLFDNYVEEELEISPDQEDLKSQLIQAGFADTQVNKAIDWLECLALRKDELETDMLRSRSIRVFKMRSSMSSARDSCYFLSSLASLIRMTENW